MSTLTDDQRCSMLYWYPIIEGVVRTPRTIFVPLSAEVEAWMDSGIPRPFVEKLKEAASPLCYPLFMRTDQLAAKHSWVETCYVFSPEMLGGHCYRLIEENLMADFLGSMNPRAMVLRRFLVLDAAFRAFKGMPIAREFRVFVKDGSVCCIHPYWPPESIAFWSGTVEPNDWRDQLSELSELNDRIEAEIRTIALTFSRLVPGYWSVDVCKTRTDGWYMTDAAVGERSFHWPDCPNAPKKAE